ncbi:MAG: hypothetical protein J0M24_02925 [Verrucomicrobia bacterium]|nr:hypothetical protein [Verrucomicrobiota bacterium]
MTYLQQSGDHTQRQGTRRFGPEVIQLSQAAKRLGGALPILPGEVRGPTTLLAR